MACFLWNGEQLAKTSFATILTLLYEYPNLHWTRAIFWTLNHKNRQCINTDESSTHMISEGRMRNSTYSPMFMVPVLLLTQATTMNRNTFDPFMSVPKKGLSMMSCLANYRFHMSGKMKPAASPCTVAQWKATFCTFLGRRQQSNQRTRPEKAHARWRRGTRSWNNNPHWHMLIGDAALSCARSWNVPTILITYYMHSSSRSMAHHSVQKSTRLSKQTHDLPVTIPGCQAQSCFPSPG